MKNDFFEKSILIVAHPDDEILWFSSILEKVERIQFCFHHCSYDQQLSNRRENLLKEYPLENMSSFKIDEIPVYNNKHFLFPISTQYGIFIFNPFLYCKYKKIYRQLIQYLSPVLSDYLTVFTHNPWGEYGHEFHVMIYNVIKFLQKKYGYCIYFDNYISTKSMKLGKKYLYQQTFPFFFCNTNVELFEKLKKVYLKTGCWTWSEKWELFSTEAFMEDSHETVVPLLKYDHIPPLNIIKHSGVPSKS